MRVEAEKKQCTMGNKEEKIKILQECLKERITKLDRAIEEDNDKSCVLGVDKGNKKINKQKRRNNLT